MVKKIESIFRTSDIRGIYPKELNDNIAYKLGKAIVSFLKTDKLIIAFDKRISSPKIYAALSKGIIEQGVDIINIGIRDTPSIYFASEYFKAPSIMITASHNPLNYNGIKIVDKKTKTIGLENGLKTIEKLLKKNKFKISNKSGTINNYDISKEYHKYLYSQINPKVTAGLNIAIDCNNGVALEPIESICSDLQIKTKQIYLGKDEMLSENSPNPMIKENTIKITNEIKNGKYDFGIAFDGDADRIIFLDEKGERTTSSSIGAIMIQELSKKNKGSIVYGLTCSKIVEDVSKLSKITCYKEKVGRTNISSKMEKTRSFLGIEASGHFYFRSNLYKDSAFITFLLMAEIFSKYKSQNLSFSEMLAPFKKYYSSEEINLISKNPKNLLKYIEIQYKDRKNKKIERIEGLTMKFDKWWFNIRKSGNENLFRLNIESSSKDTYEAEKANLIYIIEHSPSNIRFL